MRKARSNTRIIGFRMAPPIRKLFALGGISNKTLLKPDRFLGKTPVPGRNLSRPAVISLDVGLRSVVDGYV
jgi:hypothetical protein